MTYSECTLDESSSLAVQVMGKGPLQRITTSGSILGPSGISYYQQHHTTFLGALRTQSETASSGFSAWTTWPLFRMAGNPRPWFFQASIVSLHHVTSRELPDEGSMVLLCRRLPQITGMAAQRHTSRPDSEWIEGSHALRSSFSLS